jgi:hypothetical protein
MEQIVWHSRILSDHPGNKQGVAVKWFGHEWEPPTHVLPPLPPGALESLIGYLRGQPLPREAFPACLQMTQSRRLVTEAQDFTR